MNFLLIGNGVWGKNYISTFNKSYPQHNLIVANRSNWKSLINENPDGVIIATPPSSHIEIASYSLEKNIATIIEKPLALSLYEAKNLKQYSATPILVNHIHLFSLGYERIKKYCSINNINNINSCNIGQSYHDDCSPLWDYGVHEISMILDLIGEMPKSIKLKTDNNKIFSLDLEFKNSKSHSFIGYDQSMSKHRVINVNIDGIYLSYDDLQRPLNHMTPLENVLRIFFNAIFYKKSLGTEGFYDERMGLSLSFKVLEVLDECEKYLSNKNI